MNKIKLLTIAVVGLLVLNAGLLAFMYFRKPPLENSHAGPPGREGPKDIIIDKLKFDKDQVAAYEKLIDKHRATIHDLDEDIKEAKNHLYSTLADSAGVNKDSAINQLGNLQREIELVHYNHFIDIKNLCKTDQVQRYNELTSELARLFSREKNHPPPPRD